MCPACSVYEDADHFMFYFNSYEEERNNLVETLESIINSESLIYVCVINLKVLNGII